MIAASAKAIPRGGRSLRNKALQNGTAIDRAYLASSADRLPGSRDIIVAGHRLSVELFRAATEMDPRTVYELKQFPVEAERTLLTQFRFKALENYALDTDWREPADPKRDALNALRSINHITVEDIGLALDAVAANAARLGPRNKAMQWAWNRDMPGLRASFANTIFMPTNAFARRFAPLLESDDALGAVIIVLEQAFEFERTIEYVYEGLSAIKIIRGDMVTKGHWYSDLSPNMVFLGACWPNPLMPGDHKHNGRVNFDAIDGKRLARHGAVAPEGDRWHRILGGSALEYILHYLISTMDRFKRLGLQPKQGHWAEGSALLRVALNILAHIDPDEAQAELKARLTHSKSSDLRIDLERQIPRKLFDVLSVTERMIDRQMEEAWWGEGYVRRFAKEHRKRCTNGLHDENRNPYARAFYFPQGFSEPFQTIRLRLVWEQAASALNRIDGR